jgi:Fic family protein
MAFEAMTTPPHNPLYGRAQQLVHTALEESSTALTIKQLQVITGLSEKRARVSLEELTDLGLLVRERSAALARMPYVYKLRTNGA